MSEQPTSRWRALLALLRPDAARWVSLGLLIAASSALALAGPLVVRSIVDQATDGATSAQLTRLAVGYLVVALAAQTITVTVTWFATITAWRTTNAVRLRLARHVLGLDHAFHRAHTPGELIQRVDGDVTSVSEFLGRVVPRAFGAAVMVVGMIMVLAVLDWRLALGTLVYTAMSVGVVVRGRHRAVGEASAEMGSYAQLYGGIEERLTAAEDIRSNGAAEHAMFHFVRDSADALSSSVRRENAFLRMWWAVQTSVAGGSVVALIASSVMVGRGLISIGTAFLLFQYVMLLSRPLEDVVDQLETVQKANGAMVRVIDLLLVRATIPDQGRTSPPPGPLSVTFDHVSFAYTDTPTGTPTGTRAVMPAGGVPGQPDVLADIHLHFAAGRSVGIVGRSGSGKTTLSRLAVRLVEATDGTVRLGDVPIADISLDELRRRVALIPQEVELFSGTVRDNVTMFSSDPSDNDVIRALGHVGLGSLAAAGIHRELGSGGAGLSAGEAQLLALARVWLRNPDVVVLDEATARIDPDTEERLERAIAALIHGRTTIVVAHRLSTLRHVDDIVVLDHGRVIEAGQRAALVTDDAGHFHRLLALALDDDPVSGEPVWP